MNIEIQNFKSPKMGLGFIYIYMKILDRLLLLLENITPGYPLCIEFQMLLQNFMNL